jgi:hypothetical protein
VTAPNHALTGALIGLTTSNPEIALPLAFLSHFACDAIPHYDPPGDNQEKLASKRFILEQLVGGAIVCLLIVILLVLSRPRHWQLAAFCAFSAASPDLFWIPRFVHRIKTGKDRDPKSPFLRFHAWIQWKTGPRLWWIEAVWFLVIGSLVAVRI